MTVQELFEKVFKEQRIPFRVVVSRNDFKYAISDKPASLDGIPEEMQQGKVILAFVTEGKYIDPKGEILKDSEELFWEMCTERKTDAQEDKSMQYLG